MKIPNKSTPVTAWLRATAIILENPLNRAIRDGRHYKLVKIGRPAPHGSATGTMVKYCLRGSNGEKFERGYIRHQIDRLLRPVLKFVLPDRSCRE